VHPDLCTGDIGKRPQVRQRDSHALGQAAVDAFLSTAQGDSRSVRVAQQDAHAHARTGLAGKDLGEVGVVVGQEQRGVGQEVAMQVVVPA
jgi:hypothetical protein